ncbi:MAG: heavy-metal-associated domain-containing protein [Bacteroidales bacterium]
MKKVILSMMFLMGTMALFAQGKTEKFEVKGNCGMCEKRIEKAAKSVDGVTAADWDKETKMIEVSFDDSKTDIHNIHTAIAKAGHDTPMHKASDEVYEKLPACCKYDRSEEEKNSGDHDGHEQ